MVNHIVDMSNERYGRLLCIKPMGFCKSGGMVWECLCDCGNKTEVTRGNLTHGGVKSCGCLQHESQTANGLASKRHGRVSNNKSNRKGTYSTWEAMKQRCNNPNNDFYHRYGERGIRVCMKWHDFENFLMDMGERPEGMTINRIDNDGNYEPGNCK